MSDALQLRTIIESALDTFLGTYTFQQGQTTKAVSVIANNGEIEPPEGTKVEGLEVVIFLPEIAATTLLIGHKKRATWILHFKQWQQGKGVQDVLDSFLSVDLADFIVKSISEVPADIRLGIPAGAQIKLIKYSFLGD